MIILDASVLIGHFEPADAHHGQAAALLKSHLTDTFAASVITLAEVYAGAARARHSDRLHQLLTRLQIHTLELRADAARRLGELRAATKLKMPDCCVLYAAQHHNAAIATFDAPLAARAAELGLAIATHA
ncbi:type II toxin-antitoxin system VapC family toxin [Mycobacterium simiae]|uniref:Ribonuclease VapC n=1 Tax=Mycobacterium simiae TaxID=1784 RepID=A0A5B1BRH5_MYCSI|nr:PIN domain-containing protein [Mycobacterium simiae]KAA1249834.1 type II toxin-antitoxin system VapC family toxin [Mycobacterium simiae]